MTSAVRRWRVDGDAGALDALEQVIHSQPGQTWSPHWHEEWSIGAVVAGRCQFELCGQTLEAVEGDVLAIAPRAVHTCGVASGQTGRPGTHVVMVYAPTPWLQRAGITLPPASALARSAPLAAAAGAIGDASSAQQWVARALARLCEPSAALPVLPTTDDATACRILLALETAAAADEPTGADSLARACGISREHFQRVAARWLGMGPAAWLRASRMSRARFRLLEGGSIAETALACGFADQAHFTRWFRRSFGYTPGALLQPAEVGDKATPG